MYIFKRLFEKFQEKKNAEHKFTKMFFGIQYGFFRNDMNFLNFGTYFINKKNKMLIKIALMLHIKTTVN